jgi:hypothetical protein
MKQREEDPGGSIALSIVFRAVLNVRSIVRWPNASKAVVSRWPWVALAYVQHPIVLLLWGPAGNRYSLSSLGWLA